MKFEGVLEGPEGAEGEREVESLTLGGILGDPEGAEGAMRGVRLPRPLVGIGVS